MRARHQSAVVDDVTSIVLAASLSADTASMASYVANEAAVVKKKKNQVVFSYSNS